MIVVKECDSPLRCVRDFKRACRSKPRLDSHRGGMKVVGEVSKIISYENYEDSLGGVTLVGGSVRVFKDFREV